MGKPSKLAVLGKLGVNADSIRAICAAHIVSVDDVLATPRHAQPHDVARARAALWLRLEDAGVTLTRIGRLWGTDRTSVARTLQRQAQRSANGRTDHTPARPREATDGR